MSLLYVNGKRKLFFSKSTTQVWGLQANGMQDERVLFLSYSDCQHFYSVPTARPMTPLVNISSFDSSSILSLYSSVFACTCEIYDADNMQILETV